jgi:hypothetical protein
MILYFQENLKECGEGSRGLVLERLRGRLMSNVPESRPSLTVVLDGYRRAGVKRRLMGAGKRVQEQKQVHLDGSQCTSITLRDGLCIICP